MPTKYVHITDATYTQLMDSNNTIYEYGKCVNCDNDNAVIILRQDDKKCNTCNTLKL